MHHAGGNAGHPREHANDIRNGHWHRRVGDGGNFQFIGILFFVLYASNGGGNEKKASSTFYGSSKTTQTEASNQETQAVSDSTEATTDATTTSSGDTIEVQSGEGAAAIAARAGISVEKLYELNPDHMTQGYWYANPGDQVKIN